MPQVLTRSVLLLCVLLCVVGTSAAHAAGLDDGADQCLPRSDGATWGYA